MLAFGTSFPVAQILVGLFLILACAALYRLVMMTHDRMHAAFAVLLFGLSPLVFTFSRPGELVMVAVQRHDEFAVEVLRVGGEDFA